MWVGLRRQLPHVNYQLCVNNTSASMTLAIVACYSLLYFPLFFWSRLLHTCFCVFLTNAGWNKLTAPFGLHLALPVELIAPQPRSLSHLFIYSFFYIMRTIIFAWFSGVLYVGRGMNNGFMFRCIAWCVVIPRHLVVIAALTPRITRPPAI